MRSTEQCIARVAAKGTISQKEAAQILEDVAYRAEKMRLSGDPDPVVAAAGAAAMGIQDKAKTDFLRAVKNADALAQTIARARAVATEAAPERSRLGRTAQMMVGGSSRLGLADGLRSQMYYVTGASQHDSAEGMWQQLGRRVIASMGNRLRQDGVAKAAVAMRGTELEHEVAEHMWRSNPDAIPNPAQAVSKIAQQIGDALYAPINLLHTRLNAELPHPIGTATDRVARTNWDSRQLRLAAGHGAMVDQAFEAWRAREEPRMFPASDGVYEPEEGESETDARTRFLRSLWEATTSQVRLAAPHMGEDEDAFIARAYAGTGDIARRVTQPRLVHWNNARDWLDHMREFGGGDGLYAQVSRAINTESKQVALLHYFGTNPSATMNKAIDRITKDLRRSGDLDALARFEKEIPNLKNTMGRLTGELNVPVNQDWAEAFENVMTLEAAAHLGGLSITHGMAAPMTFGGELKLHGVPYAESVPALIKALVTGRGGQVEQDALADVGAYAHGYSNAIARSQGAFDHGIPGFVSFAAGHFMRATGINALMDRFQGKGVKGVLMDRLGRAATDTLDKMEPHAQAALRSYGIGDEEWNLLRAAAGPAMVNGRRWVTPHDAVASNPADVAGMLLRQGAIKPHSDPAAVAKAVQLKQWEMADQLGMYLNDAADHGAVRPGVRERAMVLGDLRPGDKSYMLWRALGQFKMWPLAALNQRLGANITRSLSNKEMASNIGLMFALATAGGALRMAVNDAASGNAQRDYRNPLTLLAAFAQGGGLGIWGDFFFGEVNRLGVGAIPTLGGPLASDFDRLVTMANDFKDELKTRPDRAISHTIPAVMRFAIGHIPFANLVYLKGALDYLAWYHIYEAVSPGWWQRTNRRLARENGRTMMGYEPGGGIPGGLPGLYGAGWGRLLPGKETATAQQ